MQACMHAYRGHAFTLRHIHIHMRVRAHIHIHACMHACTQAGRRAGRQIDRHAYICMCVCMWQGSAYTSFLSFFRSFFLQFSLQVSIERFAPLSQHPFSVRFKRFARLSRICVFRISNPVERFLPPPPPLPRPPPAPLSEIPESVSCGLSSFSNALVLIERFAKSLHLAYLASFCSALKNIVVPSSESLQSVSSISLLVLKFCTSFSMVSYSLRSSGFERLALCSQSLCPGGLPMLLQPSGAFQAGLPLAHFRQADLRSKGASAKVQTGCCFDRGCSWSGFGEGRSWTWLSAFVPSNFAWCKPPCFAELSRKDWTSRVFEPVQDGL